jgi:hypothetical protein
MAYCAVSDLKTYLGIPTATTTDDALLTALIASAQRAIDLHTHRTFEAAQDSTKYFDADEDVYGLRLDWTPYGLDLCAITSVVNGDGTTVASGQYVTEPRHQTPYYGIQLKVSSGLFWEYSAGDDPENAIAVTGKWAYSTTAPAEIVHVCKEMAALFYKQRDGNADINRAIIAGNATILPAGLSATSTAILKSYRRVV